VYNQPYLLLCDYILITGKIVGGSTVNCTKQVQMQGKRKRVGFELKRRSAKKK
jgi:hypothetical protein